MDKPNTDLVQIQLSELAQQIVHVIQACNEEQDILEEDFDSLKNGIITMESQLQTENVRIDSQVQGAGSMMQFHHPMLEEIRSGICYLQKRNNPIVGVATDLFAGIRQELEAKNQLILDNMLHIIAVRPWYRLCRKQWGPNLRE
jgi:hypothetical protein